MAIPTTQMVPGVMYYANLYEHAGAAQPFLGNLHESFKDAIAAAKDEIKNEPNTTLLNIVEVTAIANMEQLEDY